MKQEFKKYIPMLEFGIWDFQLDNLDIPYLIKECYKVKDKNKQGVKKSNIGGYQSSEIDIMGNPKFYSLIDRLNKLIQKFFMSPNIHLEGAWINISSTGHWNSIHTHSSDLNDYKIKSGVLYLQTVPKSGGIGFINPLIASDQHIINPIPGQLLIFTKHHAHFVEPNNSDQDRISIAFNCNM